jgi:hypothetical protein
MHMFRCDARFGFPLYRPQRKGPYMRNDFATWWHERAQKINQNARDKGFWEKERNDAEMFDLVHSEISEAGEAVWLGNQTSVKTPDYTCLEEELSDAIIRLMDQTYARNWDVVPLVENFDTDTEWIGTELHLGASYPVVTNTDIERVLFRANYTLSMALEDLRHSRNPSAWLAKTLVLLFRLGRSSPDWDLYGAVDAKMAYNSTRPHKHGKNF